MNGSLTLYQIGIVSNMSTFCPTINLLTKKLMETFVNTIEPCFFQGHATYKIITILFPNSFSRKVLSYITINFFFARNGLSKKHVHRYFNYLPSFF